MNNVFVLSTGRCGSTTFTKACSHFKGWTSGHETCVGKEFNFPDKHIESDPHLVWRLPELMEKYPDALYVHLWRNREDCIKSLAKRSSLNHYAVITEMSSVKLVDRTKVAERFYDFVEMVITKTFDGIPNTIHIECIPLRIEWVTFYEMIGKPEGFDESIAEWKIKYNRSK